MQWIEMDKNKEIYVVNVTICAFCGGGPHCFCLFFICWKWCDLGSCCRVTDSLKKIVYLTGYLSITLNAWCEIVGLWCHRIAVVKVCFFWTKNCAFFSYSLVLCVFCVRFTVYSYSYSHKRAQNIRKRQSENILTVLRFSLLCVMCKPIGPPWLW